MSDLVKRLREGFPCQIDNVCKFRRADCCYCTEAADEIERLEKENARLMGLLPFYERVAEMASDWCGQIDNVGTGWDDWDYCFKEMKWKVLPALNKALEEANEPPLL